LIYMMIYRVISRYQRSKNTLCLNYPAFFPESELTDFDLDKVEKHVIGLLDRFLLSEGGYQERTKNSH
jgi:hypothetical protein